MTRAATRSEIFDHRRDLAKHEERPADRQRLAVAALIGHCEAIAASGALPEPSEESLRVLIANALTAFNMPFCADRETV